MILILNFLPETNDYANFVTMIFVEIIVVDITCGAVDNTPWTFTNDDVLNAKSSEIINFKTEYGVGHCTAIVI